MTSNDEAPSSLLERGAGVAVWRQIEQILAAEIAAKGFGEDGRLPSEGELARRFDVNRHTVRRAMLGLAALGLVSVEQGRGTFVQPGAIDYTIGKRTRFTENLKRHQHSAAGKLLASSRGKADPSRGCASTPARLQITGASSRSSRRARRSRRRSKPTPTDWARSRRRRPSPNTA